MEARPRTVINYAKIDGVEPVDFWFRNLKDLAGKKAVSDRIRRVRLGTLGHVDNIGQGVWGLKIDVGPGYRVYFGQDGPVLVILLCGGEKHGQDKDAATAREHWADYKSRKQKEHGK
jgi:putative addiction module killer protein